MKVNGNLDNFNIRKDTNVLYRNIQPYTWSDDEVVTDTFQLTSNTTNPQTSVIKQFIPNQYSPKQLLYAYIKPDYVQKLIDANPNIQEILDDHNIKATIYPENIRDISNTHLSTTNAYAMQIANQMELSPIEKQYLEQACIFHDFGKILMPKEILNKPSFLTPEERAVIDTHAQLGYELLSTTNMNKRVLNLIKSHHMPLSQNNDVLGQILSVADIYSALREQRSYKKPFTEQEALNILDQKAQNGEVSTEVVNALKNSISASQAA